MMPHVHLLVGLIGTNIFVFGGNNLSYSIYFIIGSVLPDFDYILNLIVKKNSHRQLPTHFPLIYFLGAFLLGIFGLLPYFWLFIGALIHTFLDVIDWEIYPFAPFSNRPFTLFNLDYNEVTKEGNIIGFLKLYYKDWKIIFSEILIFFSWILSSYINLL
ncbi:MAG: metal-dependent hydrolase [Candidatus Heimdallarchaeota archaeon]|nr:MAG: metal-dependent hydrolase [Candidatus Heimdallarchaeota archaeon]